MDDTAQTSTACKLSYVGRLGSTALRTNAKNKTSKINKKKTTFLSTIICIKSKKRKIKKKTKTNETRVSEAEIIR